MKCGTCKSKKVNDKNQCKDCGLEICIHTGKNFGGKSWMDEASVHLCGNCCTARARKWLGDKLGVGINHAIIEPAPKKD
tara:strand:+ start:738 stop:974 length:237 start_codon:yes stop_codon:yes gene_type:complete